MRKEMAIYTMNTRTKLKQSLLNTSLTWTKMDKTQYTLKAFQFKLLQDLIYLDKMDLDIIRQYII